MRISDWSSDVCSSDLLGRHVAHLLALLQLLEIGIHQTVLVEVDLAAIRRLDEAVALIAEQAGDLAVRRHLMGLDPPGPLAGMVLQAAPGGFEGDRKRVVTGKGLSIRVDHEGRRIYKKKY